MRRSLVIKVLVCAALTCSMVVVAAPAAIGGTSTFHWVNPKPHGEAMNSVDMVDANIGYAVGEYGKIMKTYDGGTNWVEKPSPTNDSYFSVSMADSDTGWAVGDYGGIYKTDGTSGATWWKQYTVSGGTRYVTDVFAFDASHIWAVCNDGKIVRSTNGGDAWTEYDAGAQDWRTVYFTSADVGFIASYGGDLWKTTDGGANWTPNDVFPGGLVDMTFLDANHGWLVNGTGTIWSTLNAGTNWTPYSCPLGATSIAFNTDQVGWITTEVGDTLQKTTNGGANWTPVAGGVSPIGMKGVACAGTSASIAVGLGCAITRTADGTTWTALSHQFANGDGLEEIQFFDLRNGFAVGPDDVYKSTDAGLTWSHTNVPGAGMTYNMYFRSATLGWAVGINGAIYKTTNGGGTWVLQGDGVTTQNIYDVYFADDNNGWAVGEGGLIMLTTNGGTTWTAGSLGPMTFTAVDFLDADYGVIVGSSGIVYTTTDGGEGWIVSPQVGSQMLTCVDYAATNTIYVGSPFDSGGPLGTFTMVKSTNAGASWSVVDGGNISNFLNQGNPTDMHFTDANTGWALFSGGVASTSNGGDTWSYQPLTYTYLAALGVVNGTWVWVGGNYGALLSNYTPVMKTVWRFYNKKTGTHLYTADPVEKQSIITNLSAIYQFEGPCYVYDDYKAETTLVRFYKPSTNTHFYSADPEEINRVRTTLASVYNYEGPVYNVSYLGGQPVWRFYIPRTGTHFYTADPAERDNVKNNLSSTYQYEGPAYFLPQ